MSKLDDYRREIDLIDEEIIELFEQRMILINLVSKYKKENNIAVTDSNRETDMYNKNLTKFKYAEFKPYYRYVLDGFLTASKQMQKDKNK